MQANVSRIRVVTALVLAAAVFAIPAFGAPVVYTAQLSGPNEAPPNNSTGTGVATVTIDAATHTMRVEVTFGGLVSLNTNCHIHAATTLPLQGTAGVATTLPTFAGFPSGVTAGVYDNTLDMTLASSWNPTYVTNNGGTTATAEAALFQAIADGKAYLNIHSQLYPGGEIRGFLTPAPVPTQERTWGSIKAMYQ
jgi:CHRD domain